MKTIGFATQYYTLWEVNTTPTYFQDAYGSAHVTGYKTNYHYYKNISTDLFKVKELYPDTLIDEELRGKSSDFFTTKEEDTTPHILKFGKYSGFTIHDLCEKDFTYTLWLSTDCYKTATRNLVNELPLVVAHYAEIEKQKQILTDSYPVAESGIVELTFENNPNHTVGEGLYQSIEYSKYNDNYFSRASIGDGNVINVIFDEIKEVGGMYPYNMAIINGKAIKVKGKKMTLNLNIFHTDKNEYVVRQYATII